VENLHITIDVVVAGDEICGQVCDGAGRPMPFSGWLGLLGALDGFLCTSAPTVSESLTEDR
jgi:hypothetical protein